MVDYKPSASILRPLQVPRRRLLGPGPTDCSPYVLRAASQPMLGHLHPEFLEVMDDIKAGLQYAFQTTNELTIAVSGTGHLGMEAAFCNLVEAGDRVLVLVQGLWGERAKEVAERCGAVVDSLIHSPGEIFTLDEVERGLEKFRPSILFACHGESSGGVFQPLEGMGELCRRYDSLFLVDTVASLGGIPFFMDKWMVDVVYSGSQKVLNATPGAAPISFGPRARNKLASRKTKVQSYYLDMNLLMKYWKVNPEESRIYHHTAPIHAFYELKEALRELAEEGLENSWKKHRENAALLWEGLDRLGFQMLAPENVRLPTVSSVKIPDGLDWKKLISLLMNKHSIEISGGLGSLAGKILRIGLMGCNSSPETVQLLLKALEETKRECMTLQSHV